MATFLSPSLSKKTTSSTIFKDSRPLTSVPYPFLETILPGKSGLSGWIGLIDTSGNKIPEAGAYIYVYVNGFLINPPVLNADGSFKNSNTSIISDIDGNWITNTHFFDSSPALQYGQSICFRAKVKNKQISNRSLPFVLGGMPTPTNIGVPGDYGNLRAPYAGETFITGNISYWLNQNDRPNFDCNTHVYVYIDGIHNGSKGSILGEVFRNELRGTNASFPIYDDLSKYTLSLVLNNNQLDVPLEDIRPATASELFGVQDGINREFFLFVPDVGMDLKIYKNGVRLIENLDYYLVIDSINKKATVTFPPVIGGVSIDAPIQTDKLLAIYQYSAQNFVLEEIPNGIINGSNKNFTLLDTPKSGTVEVFLNGLHLTPLSTPIKVAEYTISGNTIIFDQAPQIGDLIIVDYQPNNPIVSQQVFLEIPILYPDPAFINQEAYIFSTPEVRTGDPLVYINGILQEKGEFFDFTIQNKNLIVFNPWAIPSVLEDRISISFSSAPVLLSNLVSYLNNTSIFQNNCITATSVNTVPIKNSVIIAGTKDGINKAFTIPQVEAPVNMRIFKNGVRLKEKLSSTDSGDYILNFIDNTINFDTSPESNDTLVALFTYITTNYIVGEIPNGVMNNNNKTFKLTLPAKTSTLHVYFNGMRLSNTNGIDYSINSDTTFTLINFIPAPGDILLVDYETRFGLATYTASIALPTGNDKIDGFNRNFSYPAQDSGVAINLYKNGLLQQYGLDYTIDRTTISFSFDAPQPGDSLLLEFVKADLLTNNPNDQLRLVSPGTLDIKRYVDPITKQEQRSFIELLLFGNDVTLYPGKDAAGDFYYSFNHTTGQWKWSSFDPATKQEIPLKTGQHITVRATNDTPFVYTLQNQQEHVFLP